jgi:Sulfotransferase family
MSDPVKVLYVAGLGRSGSTLFDRMLGQIPGFFSVGELREIWHRGLQQNALCGCGEPFLECPFWTKVGQRAFGGWDGVDAGAVQALANQVDKHRWVPLLVRPSLWPVFDRKLRSYLEFLGPLYRAIREVGDTRVVVDSSKAPSTAMIVRHLPDVDLRVLHLVRDSRGVAYSWTKKVQRPDIVGETVYMHQFQPFRIGTRWVTRNAFAARLSASGGVRVRYEDLVQTPRAQVQRVLDAIGEPAAPGDLDFVSDHEVRLEPTHTVMGNPSRMQSGPTELRLDEEWRRRLPRRQARVVTAMTWAGLRRYGYRP